MKVLFSVAYIDGYVCVCPCNLNALDIKDAYFIFSYSNELCDVAIVAAVLCSLQKENWLQWMDILKN